MAPPPVADIRRRMEESVGLARGVAEGGFGLARDITETALQGLLAFRNGVPSSDDTAQATDPEAGAPLRPMPTAAPAPPPPPVPPLSSVPPTPAPAPAAVADAPPVESLPIPDYDELSASQVIERLEGLDTASLEAIRAYETQHRGRNTILGKIAQLS
jgi:hypothetical protein